ncbi:cell division cycle 7-related protein kinase [Anabrus simplex]|uniref:cell division cycle 7-related protein kinase n=1 Tax=Anabrus simplex TaxID=316456 RepID=UPI0034DD32D2
MEVVALSHQDFIPPREDSTFCSFNSSISKVGLQSKVEYFSREELDKLEFNDAEPEEEQQSFDVPSHALDTTLQPEYKINSNVTHSTAQNSPITQICGSANSKETVDRDKSQIQYLVHRLPELAEAFHLHHKIGEGTFSSVFLGTLKTSDGLRSRRQFAIKHLVPTTLPSRIERELRCLQDIGGRDNVVGVDLCLRRGDCVVFIMPYLPHKRFSDYVLDLDAEETREYMKNLLLSLRRVHSFNIIHRDIKPSNFLYDRDNKRFLLVDFGLSQVAPVSNIEKVATPNMKKRKRDENYQEMIKNGRNMEHATPEAREYKHKRLALHPLNESNRILTEKICQPLKRQRIGDADVDVKMIKPEYQTPYLLRNSPMKAHAFQSENVCLPSSKPSTPKVKSPCKTRTPAKKSPTKTWTPSKKSPRTRTPGKRTPCKSRTPSRSKNIKSPGVRTPVRSRGPKSPFKSKASTELTIKKQLFGGTGRGDDISPETSVKMSSGLSGTPFSARQKFQTLVPDRVRIPSSGSSFVRVQNSQVKSMQPMSPLESEQQKKHILFSKPSPKLPSSQTCTCIGKPQVCTVCMTRKPHVAPRAGTPGFRPPEVLLKYPHQTTAVDIWATGVIMLCILSGCYPFFRSPDDVTALAEIMTVFGTEDVKKIAVNLGRSVLCSQHRVALDLRKLCERLRRLRKERKLQQTSGVPVPVRALPVCPDCENPVEKDDGCLCRKPGSAPSVLRGEFPESAYDLLERLLDLNPETRITAAEALEHPFIVGS